MTPMPTAGQLLSAQARLQGDRIGARDLERSMSYSLWNERACKLANALTGLGLKKGDRVAVLAWNRVEWLEIYVAAAKAGLVVVPINFRLTGREITYILEDCQAGAVVAEDQLHLAIDSIRDTLSMTRIPYVHLGGKSAVPGWLDYEDLLLKAGSAESHVNVSASDPWCLMYTSGTTGNPKGAIRGHGGLANLALMTAVELGLQRRDEALLVMPLCHANSLYFLVSFLYCGAAVGVFSRPSFDAGLCLHTLAENRATFTSLVPTHYEMMLEIGAGKHFDCVEKLMISSAPARVETKQRIMAMFANSGLFELYGSTEAGWVTMLHPDEQFDHVGSVGREVVGSLPIRLLDDAGQEVADGTPGELFSCGPYAFDGYWNLPEKTREAFRGDYLSVGDVAIREEDGYIRLIDRKKNMIISGGENVYPTEVEAVLARHPAVLDVAVVGMPDDRWGERVEAVVVCRDNQLVDEAVLLDWSRGQLAGYKRPRRLTFIAAEDMPRTATGKIQHNRVRDLLKSSS